MSFRGWVAGALLLVFGAAPAHACSQCLCGSPTPPGYLLGAESGRWSFGLEDRYLSKSNALEDDPGSESQIEHRIAGVAAFRPAERVQLLVRAPYVFKRTTVSVAGEADLIERQDGFGDVEMQGRFDVLRRSPAPDHRSAIGIVGALIAPTGANNTRDEDGERLDEHLQPGTGATGALAGLVADLALPGLAFNASVLKRTNGTNSHDYHYGDAVLFNAGLSRTLAPGWQAALELNGRNAEVDEEDGLEVPNTGGTVIYLAPDVRWSGFRVVTLDLLVQIPIANALKGDQHERATGRLALLWQR